MAQLVARFVRIEEVRSSNLLSSTKKASGLRKTAARRPLLLTLFQTHDAL